MSAIAAATAPVAEVSPVQPATQKPNAAATKTNAAPQSAAPAAAGPQPAPAPALAVQQGAAAEDTVTISPAAQGASAQPTSSQVALLSAEGESVAEIAQQLGISQQAVQSYLG